MFYELRFNSHLGELEDIFEGNKQKYIIEKHFITDIDSVKLVCVHEGKAVGYLAVYPKADFIGKEGFPIAITVSENSVYLAQIITKKEYQGKGVGSFLMQALIENYKGNNIYSVVEIGNKPSLHLHEKFGFNIKKIFEKEYDIGPERFDLLELQNI